MREIFFRDIIKAVEGIFFGEEENINKKISGVSIDSRKVKKGDLFIAIRGENFDGHNFIEQAFLNGAACVLSEKELDIKKDFIRVKSTRQALLDLAEYYRSLFENIKVIGITGSCGKTTLKDITAKILEKRYNVLKTKGNLNNNIGLPMSVFELENEEILILEMGTNHFGEIRDLSKVARPDVCVINNIGSAHIENFLSQDGILRAKCEIFDYAKKDFISVLNGDDLFLRKIDLDLKKVIYCGLEKKNDVYVENMDKERKSFRVNIMEEEIKLKFFNEIFIKNCVIAIGIGKYFGIRDKEIKDAIENFEFKNMRMEIVDVRDKFCIINDAYNANPESMIEGLRNLILFDGGKKRKICILGDMFELGAYGKEMHEKVGEYININKDKIDLVICIGSLARYLFDKIDKVERKYYDVKEKFFSEIKDFFWDNSVILVKASRGMKFEEIVKKLSE